jgi:hypothetical protein
MIEKIKRVLFSEAKSDKEALDLLFWSIIYVAVWFIFFMVMLALFLPERPWQEFLPAALGGIIGTSGIYLYYKFNPKKLHAYRLKHYDERAIHERRKYSELGQNIMFLIFSFVLVAANYVTDFHTLRLWLLGAWGLSAIVLVVTTFRLK